MKLPHAGWCLAGIGASLVAVAAGCESPSGPGAQAPEPRADGVNLADWTPTGYLGPGCTAALDDIAATGANSVSVVVTWYQADARSSDVAARSDLTPSGAAIDSAVAGALRRGLSVSIKPHVDVLDGTWRAYVQPELPADWFASYRALLLPLAARAEAAGATRFVVGTELAGTLSEKARWDALIADVRTVFSGDLIYAAGWDEASAVPFWNAVDLVGVDAYFPVATRNDPTRVDLLVGWQMWLARLDALRRRTGKPILFTEIGYRSVDGAGRAPSRHGDDAPEDSKEQADLYWAALEATRHESWFAGAYWWNWRVDGSGGAGDRDYTPAGKPAQAVLASYWGR